MKDLSKGRRVEKKEIYRDARRVSELVEAVKSQSTGPIRIMEVCGGQTHGILRHGIDQLLSPEIDFIHGPGCPVCITPEVYIDTALSIASKSGVILLSFGDMMRVPGSQSTLSEARAAGADIRVVYSPTEALDAAAEHPDRQVVFFAVGFETTAPSFAGLVELARLRGFYNLSLLVSHARVLPILDSLWTRDALDVQGLLAPGHVCAITGYEDYKSFSIAHHLPVVVTGFEPVDLLRGILRCAQMVKAGESGVVNEYRRVVNQVGNPTAQNLMERIFEPFGSQWRGFGEIPYSGLKLRDAYAEFDALKRFGISIHQQVDSGICRAADILSGQIKPTDCPAFNGPCCPDKPLGAPMVSTEGACAAYYRYHFHSELI